MSLYRLSHILLTLLLIGAFAGLYTVHKKANQQIEALNSYQIKEELFLIQTPYGFPALSLDQSNTTEFSASLRYLLDQLLPDEGKILHIGAQSGIHTLLISMESKLPIVALEGQPKYFDVLKKNIALHMLEDRIKTHQLNASNEQNEIKVCFDAALKKEDCEKQTSDLEKDMQGTNCHTIKQSPIDTLNLNKLSLIIIESHLEAGKVISGMKDTLLRSDAPPILLFPNAEFSKNGSDAWEKVLKERKYMIYKIEKNTKNKGFDITQLEPNEVRKNEPCFILLTKELMPIWF